MIDMTKKNKKVTQRDTAKNIYDTIYRRYTKQLGATIRQIHAWRHISLTTARKYVKLLNARKLVYQSQGRWYYVYQDIEGPRKQPPRGPRGPLPEARPITVTAKMNYNSHRGSDHDVEIEGRFVAYVRDQRDLDLAKEEMREWVRQDFGADIAAMVQIGWSDGAGSKEEKLVYRWSKSGPWKTAPPRRG